MSNYHHNSNNNDAYDESESRTASDMGERFEDEPGSAASYTNNNQANDPYYNHDNHSQYDQQSYADQQQHQQPNDSYYNNMNDDDGRSRATGYTDDPSYAQPSPSHQQQQQQYQDDPSTGYHHSQYQPREGQYDDLRTDYDDNGNDDRYDDTRGEPFVDHDPYSNPNPQNGNNYSDDPNQERYDDDHDGRAYNEQEQAPPPNAQEPRKHKYSTANLNETGKWKKWCSICLMFLLFLAFMIGLSMLFDYLFFGDVSDNGPQTAQRAGNETFSKDKQEVDAACGRTTFLRDEGALCQETCVPQYFDCCDPFDEFKLYNYTKAGPNVTKTPTPTAGTTNMTLLGNMTLSNSTNSTLLGGNSTNTTNATVVSNLPPTMAPNLSSSKFDLSDDKNTSFLDDFNGTDLTCSFDQEVRGCMAYAKCQALTGQADPASNNLPELCSMEQLEKDPDACQELCRKLDCCFSKESDNCLAEKFDLCMDYAPCQNLKSIPDTSEFVLETAPRTLDYDCFWQLQGCFDTCEKASCCSDAANSCFQANFLSCLTYAPCTNVTTTTNIVVPPQFSTVPKPPSEIIYACNAKNEPILQATEASCEEYCEMAACCFSSEPGQNCFHEDPLGCMAWDAQCQALLDQV